MAEGLRRDDDHNRPDQRLSAWEQSTIDAWDSDSSVEEKSSHYGIELDRSKQKLWSSFQSTAKSVSKLHTGNVFIKIICYRSEIF